jgi:ribose transport system substrate-binding protein
MYLLRTLVLVLFSTVLCACHNADEQPATVAKAPASPPPPAAKIFKVALVLKTLTNPFFIEMEKGARQAEKENGVNLIVKTGSDEAAIEEQIQIVDDLIQSHVDAIVIAPGDSRRLVPVLKKAQDAGIVLINIDNKLDAALMTEQHMTPIPFISVDNDAAAYQVVKFLINPVKAPVEAAVIGGIASTANSQARVAGAKRALAENPKIKLVAFETGNWKIDEAHDATQRIFKEHPKVEVLFCANDMMALGALKYLQDSGHKNVLLAGYDAVDEARSAVHDGSMAATIDQQAAKQGYQGVALAVRALHGETVPAITLVDAQLVTKDTPTTAK